MVQVNVLPLFVFVSLFIYTSGIKGEPKEDYSWEQDYQDTEASISRDIGQRNAPPRETFMNLVHKLKLLKERAKQEYEECEEQLKLTERLVKVAEFKVENCNRPRFLEIDELTKMHKDHFKLYNLELYMNYVQQRMDELCEQAFHSGNLPI